MGHSLSPRVLTCDVERSSCHPSYEDRWDTARAQFLMNSRTSVVVNLFFLLRFRPGPVLFPNLCRQPWQVGGRSP